MKLQELYQGFFKTEKRETPYRDSAEHLQELFAFLDLCFSLIASARGLDSEVLLKANEAGAMPDLTVSPGRMDLVLLSGGKSGLAFAARKQVAAARSHIRRRVQLSAEEDFVPRFELLRMQFYLDNFESFAMLLALSSEYDRKYEGIYVWLHNNQNDICATKWLAVRLYRCLFGEEPASQAAVLTDSSPLCRFLCSRELVRRDRSESAGRLVLSRRVTSYLLGENAPDPTLRDYCRVVDFDKNSYIPFREEQTRQLMKRNISGQSVPLKETGQRCICPGLCSAERSRKSKFCWFTE